MTSKYQVTQANDWMIIPHNSKYQVSSIEINKFMYICIS